MCWQLVAHNPNDARLSNAIFKKALTVDTIDGQKFYNEFVSRNYEAMEKMLDEYSIDSHDELPLLEDALSFSYKKLSRLGDLADVEVNVIPILNEWVDKKGSFHSYAIRGLFYYQLSSVKRGYGYISETSKLQIQEMQKFSRLSESDFRRAIEINPKNSAVYESLLAVGMMLGDQRIIDYAYSEAESKLPNNYWVKYQYLMHLQPKWGGSFKYMDSYVMSILDAAEKNPRIYSMRGDVSAYKGAASIGIQDYDSAIKYYNKAISCGFKIGWLKSLAYAWYKKGSYDNAILNLKKIVEYEPSNIGIKNALAGLEEMKAKPNVNWGELAKSVFGI